MILSGLGCRLQTCSCLATEWFNSTFRALFGFSLGSFWIFFGIAVASSSLDVLGVAAARSPATWVARRGSRSSRCRSETTPKLSGGAVCVLGGVPAAALGLVRPELACLARARPRGLAHLLITETLTHRSDDASLVGAFRASLRPASAQRGLSGAALAPARWGSPTCSPAGPTHLRGGDEGES